MPRGDALTGARTLARQAREAELLQIFLPSWRKHRRLKLVAAEIGLGVAKCASLKHAAFTAGLLALDEFDDAYLVARSLGGGRAGHAKARVVKPMPGKLLLDDEAHELVHGDGTREPAPEGLIWKYDMNRVPGVQPPVYELTLKRRESARSA